MKQRESNIELLRIFAILGVIVLHYNNPNIGGGMAFATEGSINFYILYVFESIFVCAVDLFILISGYFMSTSKTRSLSKPIELIIQVIAFSFGRYLLLAIVSGGGISIRGILYSLVPDNYFVILYCVLYLLSPYINILIEQLKEKELGTFIILLLLLFSVYPTIIDVFSELVGHQWNGLSSIGMYGSQWGYSIINFVLMYILGAFLRRNKVKMLHIEKRKLFCILGICVCVMVVWSRLNDRIGYFAEKSAWEYCNPIVILEAIVLFTLFAQLKLGHVRFINRLAKGTFSVFLLHDLFIYHIGIENFVSGNVMLMICHIFISPILIYLICWCAFWVYDKITTPLFEKVFEVIHLPKIDITSD